MVNGLKKISFFYLILFLGITTIFCLYYKKNKIEVKMSSYNEEIVFFDYDGKIEGMYLEANKPIEDVFLYYTIKQNALPQESKTFALASLSLDGYQIIDDTLILFLNLDNENKNLFKLMYESYLTQGFTNLRLIGNNFDLIYTEDVIFDIESDLYQIVDLDGKKRRIYFMDNNRVKINYLIISELNIISYIESLNKISLNVSNYKVNVLIENDEFDYLLNLIKLNLNGSLFSLNET